VLSENPARLYGLYPRKGVLRPGSDADIVVYDPGASHVIRAEDCVANVDYNPYEGFVTAVKTERNIKVMLVAGVCTVVAGCIVGLDIAEWATIIICCGLVIHGELCNTAMEAIVDLATQELHPLAKRAKDIAAASVYVLSITAAIVGVLVFAHALGFI